MNGGTASLLPASPRTEEGGRPARWAETTGWAHLLGQPPRWFFHLVATVPAVVLLWATSFPGGRFPWGVSAAGALGTAAFIWMMRVAFFVTTPPRRPRSWGWLVVAPLAATLVVASLPTHAALRARFAVGRSDFEDVVAQPSSAAPEEWVDVPGFPRRLGSYEITSAARGGDTVAFYEEHGAFLDLAGFVHLPGGPDATDGRWPSGLVLDLRPIGDDWYAFTVHN